MAAADNRTPTRGGKKAVPVARDARLANALAEAGWAEADEALAEVLLEFAELKRVLSKKSDASEALAMASQALARAARRRGLALFGEIGAIVDFDPEAHESSASAKGRVRIVRQGVTRVREILLKAAVKPAAKAAKRAPR